MKFKSFLFSLTVVSSIFASPEPISESRRETLDFLLDFQFFNSKKPEEFKALLEYLASQALMNNSEKTMDAALLAEKFSQSLVRKEEMDPFYSLYASFSEEELQALKATFQDPIYGKFHEFQYPLVQQVFSASLEKMGAILAKEGETVAPPTLNLDGKSILEVTKENFYEKIVLSKTPVILDFYSPSCGPCTVLEGFLPELVAEYGDQIQFARTNVAQEREIGDHFHVRGVPTLLFLKPGSPWPKVADQIVGLRSKSDLKEQISSFLENSGEVD